MKKKLLAVIMSALLLAFTTACSSGESSNTSETSAPSESIVEMESSPDTSSEAEPTPEPEPEAVDLVGDWEQVNKNSDTNYQVATIAGDTIEVYWIDTSTDTKSLYWAGTVLIPEEARKEFSWDSENDTDKTSNALLASGDATKTFSYNNGQLSYDVTAMGITQTVKLEKISSSTEIYSLSSVSNESSSSNNASKETSEYYFKDNVLVSEDVKIEITDWKVIQVGEPGNEYGDAPVIAFWYSTTNLTDNENVTPLSAWMTMFTAIQDNDSDMVNELEVGLAPDDTLLDNQLAHIKKDGTVECAVSYYLDDVTTPVILTATKGILGEDLGEQIFEIAQ